MLTGTGHVSLSLNPVELYMSQGLRKNLNFSLAFGRAFGKAALKF